MISERILSFKSLIADYFLLFFKELRRKNLGVLEYATWQVNWYHRFWKLRRCSYRSDLISPIGNIKFVLMVRSYSFILSITPTLHQLRRKTHFKQVHELMQLI